MPKRLKPDYSLFLVTLALAVMGVVMVFSSSAIYAKEKFGDANYFSFKQLLAAILGLAVMFAVMKIDYHKLGKPAAVFSILALAVTLCIVVFFLPAIRNTHRWIQLPGFSFQPSEIAKIGVVIFMAYFLEKRRGQINNLMTLIPIAVIVGALCGLIVLQKDLGTALAIALTACVLLFAAGLPMRWIGLSAVVTLPVGAAAFYLLVYKVPYRWTRILAWIDPWKDPLGYGFQIIQSLTAVGAGGATGVGYMEGRQKMFYLPDAHTDFIFAVIGEELGLIGTCAVLLLFTAFLWRGIRTSMRAPDEFGFYLALGITMTICIQAFINMSVVIGLVPNKGIPLPFLSYGGSSFLVMLAAVGVLLNVSEKSS